MADYGLEIRDEDGKVIFDRIRLTHRVWYHGIHSDNAIVNYPIPLDHEPTVFAIGIGGRGAPVYHRQSGTQYVGFEIKTNPRETATTNLIVVFARE